MMCKVKHFSFAVDVIFISLVIIVLYCFKAFVPIRLGATYKIRVLFNCAVYCSGP